MGGGNLEKNISPNLVKALNMVSKNSVALSELLAGMVATKKVATSCIIIPTVNEKNITPHSEAFQAVIWHCLFLIRN